MEQQNPADDLEMQRAIQASLASADDDVAEQRAILASIEEEQFRRQLRNTMQLSAAQAQPAAPTPMRVGRTSVAAATPGTRTRTTTISVSNDDYIEEDDGDDPASSSESELEDETATANLLSSFKKKMRPSKPR